MMDPTYTKLLVTGAALVIYVVSHFLPDMQGALLPLAGAMVGGMWLNAPGTVRVKDVLNPAATLAAATKVVQTAAAKAAKIPKDNTK